MGNVTKAILGVMFALVAGAVGALSVEHQSLFGVLGAGLSLAIAGGFAVIVKDDTSR